MNENIKKKLDFLTQDSRTTKKRLLISLPIHAFAVFSSFLFPSLEVYLKNITDFDFAFSSLILVMGLASIVLLALGIGISLILKGRLFNYYLTTLFSLSLCSYIQGTFLNSSLPALDGSQIQWQLLAPRAILNFAIWVIFFIVPFIIHFFSRKFWRKSIIYFSCLCIIMSATSLVSIFISSNFFENENSGFFSRDGLYDSSDKGDVVVFVLDYYDNFYMDSDLMENPELLSEWTGFTRFENCTGMYKQTMPSIPYLLTGTKWYCETSASEFAPKAFSSSDFLKRIKETGAQTNLYVSGSANAKEAYAAADNYNYDNSKIVPLGMLEAMTKYILYRNMPIISKSVFWHYTDDISNTSTKTGNLLPKDTTYTINDALFFSGLQNNGLTVSNNKTFKFIHMKGAHYPYVINESGKEAIKTNAQLQRKGVVHIVSEYLKEMKNNNTYDSSTIIIIADHGTVEISEKMSDAVQPILFVKPAGADSNAPVITSSAPVSQEDFHATVLWALGDENYSDFGRTFFEIKEDENRIRNFYFRVSFDGKTEESLLEYEIVGDAKDFSNWKLTGNVWGDLAKK